MTDNLAERKLATERGYDSAAQDFSDRTARQSEAAGMFLERFVDALPDRSLIADIGCGPGHDVRRMAQAGHHVVGLDRSRALLALGPPSSLRVRADLSAVPVSDNAVDGVWSSAVLLHVDRAALAGVVAEWHRILRPGGLVGFATSLASPRANNEGWEVVPAGPDRRPEIADGEQRWFVHHERESLLEAVRVAGWAVTWTQEITSHRTWLQVLAQKP